MHAFPPGYVNPFDALLKSSLRDLEVKQKQQAEREKSQQEQDGSSSVRGNVANTTGLECPVCGAVPKFLRTDGETIPRHLPAKEGVKLYRDTEFCSGQGKAGKEAA